MRMPLGQRLARFFRVLWWQIRRLRGHPPISLRLSRLRTELDEAQRVMRRSKALDISEALSTRGMAGERETLQAKAREMGIAFVDLDRILIGSETLDLVSRELIHHHRVLPLKRVDNTLYLALNEPSDLHAIDAVQQATGCRTIPVLATREALEQALRRYYPQQNESQ